MIGAVLVIVFVGAVLLAVSDLVSGRAGVVPADLAAAAFALLGLWLVLRRDLRRRARWR